MGTNTKKRSLWRILFSGVTVGCIGAALGLMAFFQELLGLPLAPLVAESSAVMLWSGFLWAFVVWYLKPFPLPGLGIVFAVLFVLIVPATYDMDFIVILTAWPYMVWAIVCLALAMVILVNAYRDMREREERYGQLLKEERIQNGRNPVTGERQNLQPAPQPDASGWITLGPDARVTRPRKGETS